MNDFHFFGENPFPTFNRQFTNNDTSDINQRMLNELTHTYRNLTHNMRDISIGYNTTINNYNQNITRILSTMGEYRRDIYNLQTQILNQTNTNTNTNTNRNTNTDTDTDTNRSRNRTPIRFRNRNTPFRFPLFQTTNNVFEDVIIRPTTEQINNAIERLSYNDTVDLINNRCPITMEDFEVGDNIIRIRHCGHTFHEDSINIWFRSNVRCPVCRYDIREYINTNNVSTDASLNVVVNNSSHNSIFNELTTRITSLIYNSVLNNQINISDLSLNQGFTLDIPITITSINNESNDDDEVDE